MKTSAVAAARSTGTAGALARSWTPHRRELITAFQVDRHCSNHDAYLADLVDAMRPKYEAIVAAGFDLQLDCPDLVMSRHTGFQYHSEAELVRTAAANVEVLNAAASGLPTDQMRMHICWGSHEGRHDHDIALERMIDIVARARPATILFQAANPRHEHERIVWRNPPLPDDMVLDAGADRHLFQLCRAS